MSGIFEQYTKKMKQKAYILSLGSSRLISMGGGEEREIIPQEQTSCPVFLEKWTFFKSHDIMKHFPQITGEKQTIF